MHRWLLGIGMLVGCNGEGGDTSGGVEPIEAPADTSARGVPVGVRTVVHQDVRMEIWYPAADAVSGYTREAADFAQFVPESFTDHVGPVELSSPDTDTVRDATLRNTGQTFPVVLFSHGFGGFRLQSLDITAHLASRGYVVIAPDHPGRMMGDVLPCLFNPPLDGCNAFGGLDDPGPEDLQSALDWIDNGDWAGELDRARIGLMGHSAGAGSTARLATDTRFSALAMMAGGDAVTRDVPALFIDGGCDGIVDPNVTFTAAQSSTQATHVRIEDAGHLAFSDLCTLDLAGLSAQYLEDRSDLNAIIYQQLLSLGVDGCPGAAPQTSETCSGTFLDVSASAPLLRAVLTEFFDTHLQGSGEGVTTSDTALTITP